MITILVILLIVAQLTPQGQAFLATPKGAAALVGVSALAILSMLPGALAGSALNVLLIGVWGYTAYQRLPMAKRFAQEQLRRLKR